MKRLVIFLVGLSFIACNEKPKGNSFQKLESESVKIEDQKYSKDLFNIIKIDSLQSFYIVYTKKEGIYYKIVSERVALAKGCNKIKTGDYLSLKLASIVPDTSKISYKVDGIAYNGVEFEFEGDSILDIYESKNLIGLCYSNR